MIEKTSAYLFSPAGLSALREFSGAGTLFAFDLDGTLAPIVPDPAAIEIAKEVRISLIRLNSLAPLAIITGRSCADARLHLGFSPRFLVGNHGAEGLPDPDTTAGTFTDLCLGWKVQLNHLLPDMAQQGIILEEKGETLALHYRQATDPKKARQKIVAAIKQLRPAPRAVSGIYVKNLTPTNAPHKGSALTRLMHLAGCQKAIFVGDDVTDEDVFSLKNRAILGIKIGESRESAACFYLNEQQEIIRLLHLLLDYTSRIEGEKGES
jgi:trehalose 6-phosphate phosphatase